MTTPVAGSPGVGAEVRPLPRLVVVADGSATGGRTLLPLLEQAITAGARGIWLRDKQADPDDRRRLAARLGELLHEVGGVLIASPGPGSEQADGWQLAAGDPVPPWPRFGRSCHGRADLDRAVAEGCSWATLSPIFPSRSKPGYGPALGLAALADTPLPTWALGGVDAGNAGECLRRGAAGVAVMGAVLGAARPETAVARILDALA